MITFKRRVMLGSLVAKGFRPAERDHTFLFLWVDGKKTSVWTKISLGSGSLEIGEPLLSIMKRQMRLETKQQLSDLIKCPLDHAGYVALLRKGGILESPKQYRES
jgi:hypothetical protein